MVEHSPRFALVGPGRAGTALTDALTRAGWTLSAVAGRTPDSSTALAVAERFGVPVRPLSDAAHGADVVLVATPDASVREAALALAPGLEPGSLVVHLAGSLGLEAFEQLASRRSDVRLGACHPLMTLPGGPADADRLCGAWFAVEGDLEAGSVAEAAGGRPFRVGDRRVYHAAACVASNHLVALLGQVERLADAAGAPAEAFVPLVEATVANVAERGAARSLTGPIARGDDETVTAHLDGMPEDERPGYRALAREALRLVDDPAPALIEALGRDEREVRV